MKIDHAYAARFKHRHALRDGCLDLGATFHRPDAHCALRLRELRDIGRRILHAQSDPTIADVAPARARDRILVQLVIEIGSVIIDEDEQWDAMAHRRPYRRRSHAEVAIPEHRDSVTSAT